MGLSEGSGSLVFGLYFGMKIVCATNFVSWIWLISKIIEVMSKSDMDTFENGKMDVVPDCREGVRAWWLQCLVFCSGKWRIKVLQLIC